MLTAKAVIRTPTHKNADDVRVNIDSKASFADDQDAECPRSRMGAEDLIWGNESNGEAKFGMQSSTGDEFFARSFWLISQNPHMMQFIKSDNDLSETQL